MGNILDCHAAIDQNDLKNKERVQKEQKSKPKDSRNLYLVKEGGKFIMNTEIGRF